MEAKFYVCPVVWEFETGLTVAIFLDRDKAEEVARAVPEAPAGGWKIFPMMELEFLAWLREQRAQGISQMLLNPEVRPDKRTLGGAYRIELSEWLLDSGKTLEFLRQLVTIHEAGEDSTTSP